MLRSADPWCATAQRQVLPEVRAALKMSEAALRAASRAVETLLKRADARDKDGPLFHAWACHAAFLAGVRWQQQHERQQRELQQQDDLPVSSAVVGSSAVGKRGKRVGCQDGESDSRRSKGGRTDSG